MYAACCKNNDDPNLSVIPFRPICFYFDHLYDPIFKRNRYVPVIKYKVIKQINPLADVRENINSQPSSFDIFKIPPNHHI